MLGGLVDLTGIALLPSVGVAWRRRRLRLRRRVPHQPESARPTAAFAFATAAAFAASAVAVAVAVVVAVAVAVAIAALATARSAGVTLCGGGGPRLIAPYEPAPPPGGARRLSVRLALCARPLPRRVPQLGAPGAPVVRRAAVEALDGLLVVRRPAKGMVGTGGGGARVHVQWRACTLWFGAD